MQLLDSTDRIGRVGETIGSLVALAVCAVIFTVTIATVMHW